MTEAIIAPTGDPDIDTTALQTAVAGNQVDIVTIAPGMFAIGKRAVRAAVRLASRTTPLLIRGAHQTKTIIKLVDMDGGSGGDCHMLAFDYCHHLTLADFTLDGNVTGFPGYNQQAHGIYLNGCESVTIRNVSTQNVIMDGVYLIGQAASSSDPFCRRIAILNTSHRNNNRSGVAVQGGVSDVIIDGFTAVNIKNSAIDTEPTGNREGPERFTLRHIKIKPRSQAYAISVANGRDFMLDDIEIVDGSMQIHKSQNVTLANGRIISRAERPPLIIRGDVDNLHIVGGEYIGRHTGSGDGTISIGSANAAHPQRVILHGVTAVAPTGRHGIQAENCDHLAVIDCIITGQGTATGINYRNVTRTEGIGGLNISGGLIANFANGVYGRAYSDRAIRAMVSQGGKLSTLTNGVLLEGHEYIEQYLFAHESEAVQTAVKLQA